MLDKKKIPYTYREYTEEPLTTRELKALFAKLGVEPAELLRKNDKAYKAQGLTGQESPAQLLRLMAQHPTLLQRPIGVVADKAVVGRPVEKLLEIV